MFREGGVTERGVMGSVDHGPGFRGSVHLPTGSVEEAELQVFPDTGPETELVDTVGSRQVCMGFP